MTIPTLGVPLEKKHLDFIAVFSKACRHSILSMTLNAQSGHPGGSLSSIDYLSALYAFIISQTGEKVVVSNGHISPAVYSVLAEMSWIDKKAVVEGFRKIGSIYEGHITRHVRGVEYGTGPLGIGVSVATGMALAEQLKRSAQNEDGAPPKVYGLMGDGEVQEGQVHEMIHFANKYHLNNFILFVDYNKIQLSASLAEVMPIDILKVFEAGHWTVTEVDAHDFQAIWSALSHVQNSTNPVVILGHSIMGKGVDFMEAEGLAHKATWHGKAPKSQEAEAALAQLLPTPSELSQLNAFKPLIRWSPDEPSFTPLLTPVPSIDPGKPILYGPETSIDCRTAYGKTLLELATLNPSIVAATADLRGSVMTKFLDDAYPDRHIECGIAEQHMVSLSGGMSLDGFIPFCSTFGVFMSSRAKDQVRVNDINQTNVKMVATHCGLSVGEDGPTHQAIDDMGSFLGLFNTMVIEPADPNQTDRIIRYIATHYGNFYVRMGRHTFPILTKPDGTPFYDTDYIYKYGRCDVIREGSDVTLATTGAMVTQALKAIELLKTRGNALSVELVAVSSIKCFDETLMTSIRKTGRVLTLEDHNPYSGLGGMLSSHLTKEKLCVKAFEPMGVTAYQLSGKWNELYDFAGLSVEAIAEKLLHQ